MNKYAVMALLAAPSMVLVSCTKTPESVFNDMCDEMEHLAELLNDCNSSNADSQAEKIEKSMKKIAELKKDMEELDKKDPEAMKALKDNPETAKKISEALGKVLGASMKVGFSDCYGSSKLRDVLQNAPALN